MTNIQELARTIFHAARDSDKCTERDIELMLERSIFADIQDLEDRCDEFTKELAQTYSMLDEAIEMLHPAV